MTFYIISDADQIVENYHSRPTDEQLQTLADEMDICLYVIEGEHTGMEAYPAVIEQEPPADDALADDLALAWISKHTRLEVDSPAYRELVRAFLQMSRKPAQPPAALVAALRPLAAAAEKALAVLWTDNDSRGYGTDEEGEAAMQLRTAIAAARAALAGVASERGPE